MDSDGEVGNLKVLEDEIDKVDSGQLIGCQLIAAETATT